MPPAELVRRRAAALNNPLDGRCEWFYGEGRLVAYREGLAPVCHRDAAGGGREAGPSALRSREVRCAKFSTTHPHAESDDAKAVLCVASNLAMDAERLAEFQTEISRRAELQNPWEGLPGPPPEFPGDSWVTLAAAALARGGGADPDEGGGGLRGTLRADCRLDTAEWGVLGRQRGARGAALPARDAVPCAGLGLPGGAPRPRRGCAVRGLGVARRLYFGRSLGGPAGGSLLSVSHAELLARF